MSNRLHDVLSYLVVICIWHTVPPFFRRRSLSHLVTLCWGTNYVIWLNSDPDGLSWYRRLNQGALDDWDKSAQESTQSIICHCHSRPKVNRFLLVQISQGEKRYSIKPLVSAQSERCGKCKDLAGLMTWWSWWLTACCEKSPMFWVAQCHPKQISHRFHPLNFVKSWLRPISRMTSGCFWWRVR